MKSASRFRSLVYVLPIIAGAAAGVVSSVILAREAKSPAEPAAGRIAAQEEAPPARPERGAAPEQHGDAPGLARRLAALEEQMQGLSERADEAGESPTEADLAAREEEQRRAAVEELQAKIALHRREPVDAAWADAARDSLKDEITALSAGGDHGALGGVECRSTSCLATVSFPSYEAAREGFGRYVMAMYDVRCARTAALDEPEDPSAPYEVKLLLNGCARP